MKVDEQFKCKDCDNYNLCNYYHNRRETSSICKEFRNQWGFIEELEKIRNEIQDFDLVSTNGNTAENVFYLARDLSVTTIDKHISELKGENDETNRI